MTEQDDRFLSVFGSWLRTLADDTELLARAVSDEELPEETRRPLAAALNYLFKSLDLIDDGIESLGFLDDAFVLRIAVEKAGASLPEPLVQMLPDADVVREFLGPDLSARFVKYVAGLETGVVRGRSVDAVLAQADVRDALLGDLAGWASRYEKPAFAPDPKNLVKLRAFLSAKLPQ